MWLATRGGKMEPSCPLGTSRCIPQEKFPRKPYNKFFIDQVCLVKMAGYWPRFLGGELCSSRSINTPKKNLANIQPSWSQSWSITHIYIRDFSGILFLVHLFVYNLNFLEVVCIASSVQSKAGVRYIYAKLTKISSYNSTGKEKFQYYFGEPFFRSRIVCPCVALYGRDWPGTERSTRCKQNMQKRWLHGIRYGS